MNEFLDGVYFSNYVPGYVSHALQMARISSVESSNASELRGEICTNNLIH